MTTTWTIAVDWDRNGNYTDTYDDVTSRISSAKWFLGSRKEYETIADESVLDLVLDNQDKRYSPEYAASPLYGKIYPQRSVRIQSNDGTTTRTHWVGWINAVEPAVGRYGKRTIRITAIGAMQFLKVAESNLTLQEDKFSDQILTELMKAVIFPPGVTGAWVLGFTTNSQIGVNTYLGGVTSVSNLPERDSNNPLTIVVPAEEGKLRFGIAADNWVIQGGASDVEKRSFDVYRAINDIVAAEHGKLLYDRDGKALFWNRHHLLAPGTPAATFDDTMTDMAYTYAGIEQTKNEVIVVCHPRTISATATDILWQLGESPIQVEAGKTKIFNIHYEDEGKKRVGGKEVFVTDLEFAQGSATVTIDGRANGAEIKIVNGGKDVVVLTKCVIKGKKILDSGEMEAKAINQFSIDEYGRRTLRINLPSIDTLDRAQDIADFERDRRSIPRGDVASISLLSDGQKGGGQHSQQLARTLGDLITVKETQTAHDKNYHIIGEAHELSMGATLWKTTWYLEPATTATYWKLGTATLGETTTLAY